MEIYQIDTGKMKMKKNFYLFPGRKDKQDYPSYVYLIHVDSKNILLDTGLQNEQWERIGIFKRFLTFENVEENDLKKQLKNIGYEFSDMDYLVCSHMHFDHTGFIEEFGEGKIVVQQSELEAFLEEKKNPMYLNDKEITMSDYTKVDGESVILDGMWQVRVIPTPGHSAGHQSLIIENEETFVLFVVDAGYDNDGEISCIETPGTKGYEVSLKSTEMLVNLIREKRESKNIKIFYSHDNIVTKETFYEREQITDTVIKYCFSN